MQYCSMGNEYFTLYNHLDRLSWHLRHITNCCVASRQLREAIWRLDTCQMLQHQDQQVMMRRAAWRPLSAQYYTHHRPTARAVALAQTAAAVRSTLCQVCCICYGDD